MLVVPKSSLLKPVASRLTSNKKKSLWEGESLPGNPNDGIEWPRLVLPWWQAPWIWDRRKRESKSWRRRQTSRASETGSFGCSKRGKKNKKNEWSRASGTKAVRIHVYMLHMSGWEWGTRNQIQVDHTLLVWGDYLNKIYMEVLKAPHQTAASRLICNRETAEYRIIFMPYYPQHKY